MHFYYKFWWFHCVCSFFQSSSVLTVVGASKLCCVQFSVKSQHLLAYGGVDSNVYCIDIRDTTTPLCTLVGHANAVSYVKFLDSKTIVSASTDNTLKIWDLNKSSCISTLRGHTNEQVLISNTYLFLIEWSKYF